MRGGRFKTWAVAAALLALVLAVPSSSPAANTMVVQPDGKVVLGGYASPGIGTLIRFDVNGRLDGSFGDDGIAIEPRVGPFKAIAMQSNGRIIGASDGVQLARFLPDGSADKGFGSGGVVGEPDQGYDYSPPAAVLVLPDQTIEVGGTFSSKYGPLPFGFVDAYRQDGSIIGRRGRLLASSQSFGSVSLSDLLARPDGSLIVTGVESAPYQEGRGIVLARFLPGFSDSYDPSFGAGSGVVEPILYPGDTSPRSAKAVISDGSGLLVAGTAGGKPLLLRFGGDGVADAGFGQSGVVNPPVPNSLYAEANDAALQADGKIVIAGATKRRFSLDACDECWGLLVSRFAADGTLDTSFGTGGMAHLTGTADGGFAAKGEAVAVLPDGKIIVSGLSTVGGVRFLLVRFNPDGTLDASFGRGGIATALPCSGSAARQRRFGCLPSARVRLRLRRSPDRPALYLRVRQSQWWGRMSSVRLILPQALRARPGLVRRVEAIAIDGPQSRKRTTPKVYPGSLVFDQMGHSRALTVNLPKGFLRAANTRGREVAFRVKVRFWNAYGNQGEQTVHLRRRG